MKTIDINKIERITIPEIDIENESAERILKIGKGMIAFVKDKGLGLSACQIGIFKQLFVMKHNVNNFQIVINPKFKLLNSGKTKTFQESCLSLPDEIYYIKRFTIIWVEFYSIKVTEDSISYFHKSGSLKGIEACTFQHEYDHCQGITLRMKGIKIIK